MIQVCGHRVLVKPFKLADVDEVYKRAMKSGIEIVRPNEKREDASVDKGVVLAVGPNCWPEQEPWCKVGDIVLWAKFSHKTVEDPETKDELGILNDEDIVAVLKEKSE